MRQNVFAYSALPDSLAGFGRGEWEKEWKRLKMKRERKEEGKDMKVGRNKGGERNGI